MKNKTFLYILTASFCLAVFLSYNFSLANKADSTQLAEKQATTVVKPAVSKVVNTQSTTPNPSLAQGVPPKVFVVAGNNGTHPQPKPIPLPSTNPVEDTSELACAVYGPATEKSKILLDPILEKENILNQATIIVKPLYEIYWNLGKNKEVAQELFEKQKNGGSLSEDKYQLKNDVESGNWIVSIAQFIDDEETTKSTVLGLAQSANRKHVGGRWQYRSIQDVYFYQFSNARYIPKKTRDIITNEFSIPKAPC